MRVNQQKQTHSISREVMDLLSPRLSSGAAKSNRLNQSTTSHASAPLPPIVPTFPSVIKKNIQKLKNNINQHKAADAKDKKPIVVKPARRWLWAPFASSARTDGALFYHWVRAGVEYPDYPYARFNIHMDTLMYTDREYEEHFNKDPNWTKTDTDRLFELVRVYELRWPIIHDRWLMQTNESVEKRPIHVLQHRYYQVTTFLNKKRLQEAAIKHVSSGSSVGHNPFNLPGSSASHSLKIKQMANSLVQQQAPINLIGTGTSTMEPFLLEQEIERRKQLEALWNRPKEEEKEEITLRKELKLVESQIRKMKKSGSHLLQRSYNQSTKKFSSNVANVNNPSQNFQHGVTNKSNQNSTIPSSNFDQAFAATAPIPTPSIPYLQSARLAMPATGGHMGLNKSIIQKMQSALKELKIPERPTCPTKRVCDLFDSVRKNALILISLEKIALKKEGDVVIKRARLETIKVSLIHQAKAGKNVQNSNATAKKTVLVAGGPTPVINTSKQPIQMPINSMAAPTHNAVPATLPKSRATTTTKNKRRSTSSKASKSASNTSFDPNSVKLTQAIGDNGMPIAPLTTKKSNKRKSKKSNGSAASVAAAAAAAASAGGNNPASMYSSAINSRNSKKVIASNVQRSKSLIGNNLSKQGQMIGKVPASKKGTTHSNVAVMSSLPSSSIPHTTVNGAAANKIISRPNVVTGNAVPYARVAGTTKAGGIPNEVLQNIVGQNMNSGPKGNNALPSSVMQEEAKPTKKRARKS